MGRRRPAQRHARRRGDVRSGAEGAAGARRRAEARRRDAHQHLDQPVERDAALREELPAARRALHRGGEDPRRGRPASRAGIHRHAEPASPAAARVRPLDGRGQGAVRRDPDEERRVRARFVALVHGERRRGRAAVGDRPGRRRGRPERRPEGRPARVPGRQPARAAGDHGRHRRRAVPVGARPHRLRRAGARRTLQRGAERPGRRRGVRRHAARRCGGPSRGCGREHPVQHRQGAPPDRRRPTARPTGSIASDDARRRRRALAATSRRTSSSSAAA